MSLVVRPNSSAAGPVAGGSAKWLWAAIGALGVSVLALGATLVVQNRDRAPDVASAVQPAAALAPDAQSAAAANPSINPAAVQGAQGRPSAVAQAPAQQFAQRAPSPSYAPQPAYSGAPQGQQQVAMQRAAAPACMTCGRVESVQAFQQAAPATGIGAVAGGVIGGVLGNQVGKGSGRTAATVLGAVGGGYLGHTVEQRTRTTTAYQIRVRMDDGSVRTFTRSQPVAEGTAVRVEGRSFRVDNGQYGSGYGGGYSAQAPHSVRVADNGY